MYAGDGSSMVRVTSRSPAAMTNSHTQTGIHGSDSAAVARAEFASSLQGLLDVSAAVRSGADVGSVLETIAGAVSKTLGFQTVVLNVYRPEWDDFYVQTVYGSTLVRKALLGQIYNWDSWRPLLHPRFLRAGAYFIPNDAFDWSTDTGTRFVPDGEPLVDGPGARAARAAPARARAAPAGLIPAAADDDDGGDPQLRLRGRAGGARIRQGPDRAPRGGHRAASPGGVRRLGRERRGEDCRARAFAHLQAVRAALRDRRLLPRSTRRGRAPGRPQPGRLRVGPQRTWPRSLESPLARGPPLRHGRHGQGRPLGRRAAKPAASDRERAPGAAHLREPRDGGAGSRDPARRDALPGRPRPSHPAPEPARVAPRAAGGSGTARAALARARLPRSRQLQADQRWSRSRDRRPSARAVRLAARGAGAERGPRIPRRRRRVRVA